MSYTPTPPTSTKCKRNHHADCTGYASVSTDYGNTPCWCECHDTDSDAEVN
jgi:hypothetical protein